jgi:porphobilinogen synthase
VREAKLTRDDFVLPLFVCSGTKVRREVSSMPGVFNLSVDETAEEVSRAFDIGVRSVIVFGLPESKDETATGAYAEDGVVQRALRAIKKSTPEVIAMADTCLCEYTSHGHCGVVRDGDVVNDESLKLLAKTALSQAEASADVVAPSAMMDGQVAVDSRSTRHIGL